MKRSLIKLLLFTLILTTAFTLCFSASAVTEVDCIVKRVDVSTFNQLKAALENFVDGGNIILGNDIVLTDDAADCCIEIKNYGDVAVNLNGFDIRVNSKKTTNLFNITGQANIYFLSGKENRSVIHFNTVKPDAAAVKLDNKLAKFTNVNIDFTMGTASGYTKTENGSDSYVFRVNSGSEINFYKGVIKNSMESGCGIYIAPNENNRQKLHFKMGGYTTVEADKYCISFDPTAVRNATLGSVKLTGLNSDKGKYARINVPASSTLTVTDLWDISSDSRVAVYVGGKPNLINSKKIVNLDKADIVADRICETLSNTEDVNILNCSAGHVEICGSCFMACRDIDAHNNIKEVGVSATCTQDGYTNGDRCTECNYTTAKTISKKGHDMKYTPKVEEKCGVDGIREHYFCNNCKGYFEDVEGKKQLRQSDIVIKNNHQTEYLPQVFPTCTETGLTSGVRCLTCGKVVEEQKLVPKKGHMEVPIADYVEATCNKEGRTEGKKCSLCQLVIEESKVIPQKPHTTKIIEGYPASCTQEGLSFGEYCEVCGYIVRNQEKIPPKGHIEKILKGKEATCKEDGLTDGLVCENCDLVLKNQEKIEKGAHKPQITEGKKATCKETGLTDGSVCSVCGIVLKAQDVIPISKEHTNVIVRGTPATCEKEGLTDGIKCDLCEKEIEPQTVIAKLSHTEKIVRGTPATCEKEGFTDGIKCDLCEKEIEPQRVIAKLPHTEKIVKGKEATCEEKGKTDGIICSVCEKVIEKQETIPAKGHTAVSSVVRADLKNDGEIKESCGVCKKALGIKTISKVKSIKLSASSYTYNGKSKKPSVTVKNAKGETLKKDEDYTVAYSSGRKAVGTYSVEVTFKGNYSGEKTLTFKIKPGRTEKITVNQTESTIKLSWKKVEGATGYRVYIYNEKTKKYKTLGTTEKLSCSIKKLKSGTTYKFSVKAYTKTSKGTVWAEETHRISAATKPAVPSVTAKAGQSKATLNWKKVTGITGYIVYMSEKKDSGYKKLGSTSKLSCTVKNLKKGKTYYFKVKAYKTVDGKNVYGDACKYIKVKIK